MTTKLARIAEKARRDQRARFTSLAHVLTPDFLMETWGGINKRGASGVDAETTMDFGRNLTERVGDLYARLRAGRYRSPPVRKVEIPKAGGKTRALGIPTVEDRLLQAAVARILSAVFEPNFSDCSYGYRPRRSAHDALKALRSALIAGNVMQIFEADIRAYFDRINHEWLRKMLAQRIADPVILRLIDKWLRAGVMAGGVVTRNDEGVPQGGPISPILANIYLHYVLDLWFEKRVRRGCRGSAFLFRFADDFVAAFQFEGDVARFQREVNVRMQGFGLELAPEKTRRLVFGRFARERLKGTSRRPGTFDFLGFKHVCGTDRSRKFSVVRIPSTKSLRKFRSSVRDWLKSHIHWRVRDQQAKLSRMLTGFYNYFALPHCGPKLYGLYSDVMRMWRKAIMRRSQRSKSHWSYLLKQKWFELPTPTSRHPEV